jgi:hypothetical protein
VCSPFQWLLTGMSWSWLKVVQRMSVIRVRASKIASKCNFPSFTSCLLCKIEHPYLGSTGTLWKEDWLDGRSCVFFKSRVQLLLGFWWFYLRKLRAIIARCFLFSFVLILNFFFFIFKINLFTCTYNGPFLPLNPAPSLSPPYSLASRQNLFCPSL